MKKNKNYPNIDPSARNNLSVKKPDHFAFAKNSNDFFQKISIQLKIRKIK